MTSELPAGRGTAVVSVSLVAGPTVPSLAS